MTTCTGSAVILDTGVHIVTQRKYLIIHRIRTKSQWHSLNTTVDGI